MKYYMITKRDVGRRYLRLFGRVYVLADSIGYVMAQDVGKKDIHLWGRAATRIR